MQIYAIPVGASPAPTTSPSAAPQTFPVTTPSPCSQASDGSKTCTFDVQAPLGEDRFIVVTYDVPSPGPSNVPLAVFETGVINVQLGATPPPIALTLTGVVASVDLTMQSPDPGITTSSTQLQTVGTPLTAHLSITPRDASNSPIVTDTFQSPITISLAPVNSGVTLSLSGSQCSPASAVNGGIATITCAKDLGSLTYTYDGSIARDGLKHVVDRFTFSAQPQAAQTPAPATLALTEAMTTQPLPVNGLMNPYPLQFVQRPDGTFNYLAGTYNGGSAFGSFDPSNPSNAVAAGLLFSAAGIAVTSTGDIWIGVHADITGASPGNSVRCYTSISSTETTASSLPNGIAPYAMATDGNGNIWYFGRDFNSASWAGYFTPGPNCSVVGFMPNPIQIGSLTDYPQAVIAAPNSGGVSGVYLLSESNGNIYQATTSNAGGVITKPVAAPAGSYYGQGVAIDGAGNLYASLVPNAALSSVLEQLQPGGTLNTSSLPSGVSPDGLAVYPFTGNPSTLAFADASGLATLDVSSSFATNLQIVPLPNYHAVSTFFDANGDPWMAYSDRNSVPHVAHLIRTSVWTIAGNALSVPTGGGTVPIAISETGASGPFTISNVSDPTVATAGTPWPNVDHLLPLQFASTASTSTQITITVKDNNGRSQTMALAVARYVPSARHTNKIPLRLGRPH